MAPTRTLQIHFPKGSRSVLLAAQDDSDDLAEMLRRADLPLNTRCGRQGLCDGCLVELLSGSLSNERSGEVVSADEMLGPIRACEHLLLPTGNVEIRIPARSLLGHEPQVVTSFRLNVTRANEPLWQRVALKVADLPLDVPLPEAVVHAVALQLDEPLPLHSDSQLQSLRRDDRAEWVMLLEYRGDHWDLRPLDAPADRKAYGLAIDVGTTTVVMVLVDLEIGEVAGTASALNAQIYLGDNVLTRISLCLSDKASVHELQEAITEKTLAPLLDSVLMEAGVSADQVVTFSIAANTTMLHLLAGVDPSSMGAAPFPPTFLEHRVLSLRDLPINTLCCIPESEDVTDGRRATAADTDASLRPRAVERVGRGLNTVPAVHLLPGAAAYVGADVTAGVLSSGMAYRSDPCLLVDVGTNGEIVLKYGDHLIGCATAAGPAFEGSGLNCGMRAGDGAVSHICLTGDPLHFQAEVIGENKPIGICGTAYVDFVTQAFRHGLINRKGRITEAWKESELIHQLRHGRGFLIAQGRGREPVVISEADIASLLQAKAAIATGVVCLLRRFNLSPADIATLYLGGGFGFHMDLANLIGCGLLPGFDVSQVQVVGNTSLAGAYLALLDASAIEEMKRISEKMELVELNLEPDFTSQYTDQLWLP